MHCLPIVGGLLFILLVAEVGSAPAKTILKFKVSLRCKSAPKHWCFRFRFYESDKARENPFVTPETAACSDEEIFSAKLVGKPKNKMNSEDPYQLHWYVKHNCTEFEEDTWRVVDLHYKDIPVDTRNEKFKLNFDVTDNGIVTVTR